MLKQVHKPAVKKRGVHFLDFRLLPALDSAAANHVILPSPLPLTGPRSTSDPGVPNCKLRKTGQNLGLVGGKSELRLQMAGIWKGMCSYFLWVVGPGLKGLAELASRQPLWNWVQTLALRD